MSSKRLPLFSRGDLDGFFGLFVDNLVQLLLIVQFCALCGIGSDSPLLLGAILPGVAVSLLLGNVFYAWQARRVAAREGRDDVTALPYGINTPSLLVYIFFVMKPVYDATGSAEAAWAMGLIACLGSGVIEFLGAFVAGPIRRYTPRAALLATLAGIAIGFISMTFALEIFHRPLVAMIPLAIILGTYFAGQKFPLGLPGGFLAVLIGTAAAWLFPLVLPDSLIGRRMDSSAITTAWENRGFYSPQFFGEQIFALLRDPGAWLGYLTVIVPMGLFNLIGSLQNIESAEAGGDRFGTASSLAVNGVGTIAAALFGSCFPTTIYIGHPGWKGLGARAGYSTLNGLVITAVCLTGTVGVIGAIVPLEAGISIVLWIGVIITAQAFQTTESTHAPAVAIGLFPAIAAWGATVMLGVFAVFGFAGGTDVTVESLLRDNPDANVSGFLIAPMIALERGYIFTCMFLAAASANLIDGRFRTAALWMLFAALLTFGGLMHAFAVEGSRIDYLFRFEATDNRLAFRADGVAIGYLAMAVCFLTFGWMRRGDSKKLSK